MAQNCHDITETVQIPDSCEERYLPQQSLCTQALDDAAIVHGGVSRLYEGYKIGRCKPRRHMFIVTSEGSGTLVTGAAPPRSSTLDAGSVAYCPAGMAHLFTVSKSPWVISWFYLADKPLWSRLRGREPIFYPTPDADRFRDLCENYIAEQGRLLSGPKPPKPNDDQSVDICCEYARLVASYVSRYVHLVSGGMESRAEKMRGVFSAVRRDPSGRWTVAALAERAGLSEAQFAREMRRLTGRSPWQEVIRIRMELARDLLLTTDYPLKLIATRVGYADAFVFSTAFKRYAGVSPLQLRRTQ